MGSDTMEEPYALLSTPKPFGGKDSRSYAAAVHRYNSVSARQRNEVAVAIDGEGIYIYDVRYIPAVILMTSNRFSDQYTKAHHILRRLAANAVHMQALLSGEEEIGSVGRTLDICGNPTKGQQASQYSVLCRGSRK